MPRFESRRPLSEKAFMAQIQAAARLTKWRVYHTHDSRRSAPGFPDLVLLRGSAILFSELKTDRGKLTPDQVDWISALQQVDKPPVTDVWRPSDWDRIIDILSGKS